MLNRIRSYVHARCGGLLLGGLLVAWGSGDAAAFAPDPVSPPERPPVVENVEAFARLFGVLRYFHPSDAAARVDWERFAVHGVRRVRGAERLDQLGARLDALVTPIAPTVQVFATDGPSPQGNRIKSTPSL